MTQHDSTQHDHDGISEDREQSPPVYFTVLFYGLIIWGVAFSAFYLLSGWSSDAEFQQKMSQHQQTYQKTEPPPKEVPVAAVAPAAEQKSDDDGAALYAQLCAMCHGNEAKGGVGPDLTAAEYIHGKDKAAVSESIAKGRPGGMPGFAGQLDEDQIEDLVEYLLEL